MKAVGDSIAPTHAISSALTVLAGLIAVLMIVSFWPGPIGHDFHLTLQEAASWQLEGHQPPAAAIATWLLTLGSVNPTLLFVIKVIAYFGTLGIFLFWARAPLIVRLGAAAIVFSPAFVYLSPILRNNCLQLVFLGVAIAAGLSGRSIWHIAVAGAALIIAAMFSPAPHLGHVGLVVLFLLWQFPQWSLARTATMAAVPVVALWAPTLAAKVAFGNVDRSSTLYVSALIGIGGLYDPGEKTCLSDKILRGEAASPEQVYAEHYVYPDIPMPFGSARNGFKLPEDVPPEERRKVISCWFKTILANPGEFIAERASLAIVGLRSSPLEPPFVWFQRDGGYVLNPGFSASDHGVELNGFARALIAYGIFGNRIKVGSIKPYLVLFILTSLAVLTVARNRRLFVLVGAATVFGFMMPHLFFAQGMFFRYHVETAYVASWLSLVHLWILATDTLTLPPWLRRMQRGAAERSPGPRSSRA